METKTQGVRERGEMGGKRDLRELGCKLVDSAEKIFKPTGITHVRHTLRNNAAP